jgi:hypothetical protein
MTSVADEWSLWTHNKTTTLKEQAMTTMRTTHELRFRELDRRKGDGIEVRLLWSSPFHHPYAAA